MLFILADGSKTYTKLSFNVGPGGQVLIPVEIDYSLNFGPRNQQAWDTEYKINITATTWHSDFTSKKTLIAAENDLSDYALPYDFINELEQMDPCERQFVLDELADRPELWDEESEVMYL